MNVYSVSTIRNVYTRFTPSSLAYTSHLRQLLRYGLNYRCITHMYGYIFLKSGIQYFVATYRGVKREAVWVPKILAGPSPQSQG
jgi:hypothetical protein